MSKEDLIKRNCAEIINEGKIKGFMKRGFAYCGYECSGEIHLGHLVTILKLLDLQKAGIKVKVLLADWHTWLNQKGDWKFVNTQVNHWEKGFKAFGLKTEIIKGTSFQKKPDYFEDILKLALKLTVNRGVRAMQEVARNIENAKISQIIYPLMQIEDVKKLGINFVVGGLDQRKIYALGIDQGKEIGLQECVYLFTPIIPSLKGPGSKMSSSDESSLISIRDSKEVIKKKIKKAYCKKGDKENNPLLLIAKLIIFSKFGKLDVKRDDKFGGNLNFDSYEKLEKAFESGKLHSADLKQGVAGALEKIIAPIRMGWK
ncbi:MAG: tyrosine--tRNA ligase [Nanoarchaeota archaeon]|nr:tyrosine--tRNA ligase [Nanoarchaeota archaeon]MBU1027970.1 tyrosine--tRNA ligase [Nanoarchaeota archaeon]